MANISISPFLRIVFAIMALMAVTSPSTAYIITTDEAYFNSLLEAKYNETFDSLPLGILVSPVGTPGSPLVFSSGTLSFSIYAQNGLKVADGENHLLDKAILSNAPQLLEMTFPSDPLNPSLTSIQAVGGTFFVAKSNGCPTSVRFTITVNNETPQTINNNLPPALGCSAYPETFLGIIASPSAYITSLAIEPVATSIYDPVEDDYILTFPAVSNLQVGTLNANAIPEPAPWLLIMFGVGPLAIRAQRQRLN